MATTGRREFLISKGWIQAVALVVLIGFFVLGLLAYRTYQAKPPVPARVVDESGEVLFTGEDVSEGQQVFLENGLMEYGSVFGHGAYLGPDYTADYLRRSSERVRQSFGGAESDSAVQSTIQALRTNRYDEETDTLTFSEPQAAAFRDLVPYYSEFFSDPETVHGLRPDAITDQTELRQLTAFFAWTAWAAAAERPGHDYSYTNNWPPEPRVDNKPTANVIVWSVLSLIALLGGIGLLFGAFGRWGRNLGWHGREQATLSFRAPGDVALTPAQRATAWFFFVMAALFLVQTFVGAAAQHYRAEIDSFFGFDLAQAFPYNLMRTWHVQLAIFWVATSFVAAGIFLAPMIARREPKGQGKLAFALLGALAIVVFGTLIGSFLGVHGVLESTARNWFGLQGFEYLDLARIWQILLSLGLVIWVVMLWRVLRRRLASEHPGNMPWLFFLAACAIPAFYAVGLVARTGDNFTVTEFWRFWVVHLWVEDFLELFTTVMVAYMFVLLGVVRERIALTVVFLDIVLYSAGGVIGTMHHLYFSGEPAEHMALGAFFSAAEVIPLTFLTVEAWSFLQLGAAQESRSQTPFPHRWAVMFLVAVGFWNFLGAGIFGFLINLPIVSYYEIGTALTANHGHAAMMGVYGMLALGLAMFCLRYLIPAERWPERWARMCFWATNIGLAWMCFATLLPLGILQLYKSVDEGYFEARELDFLTNDTNRLIEWLRLPGDIVFIAGGAVPALYIAYLGVRYTVKQVTLDEPDLLFTDVHHPEDPEAREGRGGGGEGDVSPEVFLAAGYAGLLVAGAFVLEWLSAHTHRRALRYRTAGFTYDEGHDHWICPEGEQLWPHELDRERRLVRYRARAQVCNACPSKPRCTDSDHGREIVRPLDPWPHSEAGRFHRVIALLLVALSVFVLVIELARHHALAETGLLLGLLVVTALAGRWLLRDLRVHPANFPAPTASQGLRLRTEPPDADQTIPRSDLF